MRPAVVATLLLVTGQAFGQPLQPEPARPGSDTPRGTPPAPVAPSDDALARFEGRPIREIRLEGLRAVNRQLVENQIRSRTGQPFSVESALADIQRLTRLGRFRSIDSSVQPFDDGSVALVYAFGETPIIDDVQAVGNRQIPDAEIGGEIDLLKNTPVDDYQIGAAVSRIQRMYRDRGYYQATVEVEFEDQGNDRVWVVFNISEGERVRVTDIRFTPAQGGTLSFEPRQLSPNVKTKVAGIFEKGPLDNETVDRDVAELIKFYKDRGYLDVRADRELEFSPNNREVIVEFVIDEGPVYTLRSVRFDTMNSAGKPAGKPPRTFDTAQIAGLMEIKAGDVYSVDKVRRSVLRVRNAYAQMGFADVRVNRAELRDPSRPEVDLLVLVNEGGRFKTGLVQITGNELTQQNVPRRELHELRPDRPLNTSGQPRPGSEKPVMEAQNRLEETRLFEPGSSKITVQPEDPTNPGYRDMLVEIAETNTGSLSFGAGVSSDLGVLGSVRLNQRNFDLLDLPDSPGELFRGRAFRGAGQQFTIDLAPGTEVQNYSISLTDPALFDSDYNGSGSLFYRTHEYDEYDETRFGGRVSLGRRFGERWNGQVFVRYDVVEVSDLDGSLPQDYFDVEGQSDVTGLGVRLQRTTVDSRFRPTRGTRLELEAERVGVLGGDYEFSRLSAEHQLYLTVAEDFLGYRTVLSFKTAASYIPEGEDEAPVFERFYLGGRSFRGFQFRTVSPKGLTREGEQTDDPVGGTWSFFLGTELERPVFQDIVALVGFIDSGTVTNDIGFDDYRVSAGVGMRLYIRQLGPVPLAFDVGFPLLKQSGDEERIFTFSVDLPF